MSKEEIFKSYPEIKDDKEWFNNDISVYNEMNNDDYIKWLYLKTWKLLENQDNNEEHLS
jgi:hypothetical protein